MHPRCEDGRDDWKNVIGVQAVGANTVLSGGTRPDHVAASSVGIIGSQLGTVCQFVAIWKRPVVPPKTRSSSTSTGVSKFRLPVRTSACIDEFRSL